MPGFWMYETTGVLRPAVEAYLNGADLTPEQIAALRAYFRQWIGGDWRGPGIDDLRASIDGLTTRVAISRWVHAAIALGLDPL